MAGKSTNYSMDDDFLLPMPMLIDQFEAVANQVRFEKAKLRDACKAVLVDGIGTGEAAAKYGLSKVVVSRKNGQLLDRWKKLCDDAGLVPVTVAVPQDLAEYLKGTQRFFLESLRRQGAGSDDD